MLPSNAITAQAIASPLLYPNADRTQAMGGVALGDASHGREVRIWRIDYVAGNLVVSPDGGTAALTLAVPGVNAYSLAFDSNNNVAIGYMTDAGAHLYYFDSYTTSFITLDIPNATSCQARTDDTRDFNSAASDVIFAYTLGTKLYWRTQRDHYAVAREVGDVGEFQLSAMGMNVGERFQFELRPR